MQTWGWRNAATGSPERPPRGGPLQPRTPSPAPSPPRRHPTALALPKAPPQQTLFWISYRFLNTSVIVARHGPKLCPSPDFHSFTLINGNVLGRVAEAGILVKFTPSVYTSKQLP